jgi:hypothetical protein
MRSRVVGGLLVVLAFLAGWSLSSNRVALAQEDNITAISVGGEGMLVLRGNQVYTCTWGVEKLQNGLNKVLFDDLRCRAARLTYQ